MIKIYENNNIEIYKNYEGYYIRYENNKYVGTYTNFELSKIGGHSNVIQL